MLEERKYTIAEMSELMGTQDRQGIKKRLNTYEIEFEDSGWGSSTIFNIKNIPDKFRVFCVIDLKVPPQTDFTKLKYFLYYFFCDDTFAQIPDEAKEERLRGDGKDISRQTISKYIERLNVLNLISKNTDNFNYYFALGGYRRTVSKEEYTKAWREYWEDKNNDLDTRTAISNMCRNYGGVAKKYPVPEWNGIFMDEINYIIDLVSESVENESAD